MHVIQITLKDGPYWFEKLILKRSGGQAIYLVSWQPYFDLAQRFDYDDAVLMSRQADIAAAMPSVVPESEADFKNQAQVVNIEGVDRMARRIRMSELSAGDLFYRYGGVHGVLKKVESKASRLIIYGDADGRCGKRNPSQAGANSKVFIWKVF